MEPKVEIKKFTHLSQWVFKIKQGEVVTVISLSLPEILALKEALSNLTLPDK